MELCKISLYDWYECQQLSILVARRFTQLDPIGLAGGINLYQYVSNPFNRIDPLGLTGTEATGRPLSSPNDNAWFQTVIPSDIQTGSRSVYFQNANQQLYGFVQKNTGLMPWHGWTRWGYARLNFLRIWKLQEP